MRVRWPDVISNADLWTTTKANRFGKLKKEHGKG
jgi:hypothetical protein